VLKALELHAAKTLMLVPGDANIVEIGEEHTEAGDTGSGQGLHYDIVNNQMLLIQKSAVEVLQNTFKN